MKMKFIGLIALTSGIFLGIKIGNDHIIAAQENTSNEVKSILEDFYNEGYYIKDTKINISNEVKEEIQKYFHASCVSLQRTTYYEGNSLWMNNDQGVNSGYCNVDNGNINDLKTINPNVKVGDMAHFYKLNNENKYDYTVDKTHRNWVDDNEDGMEGFYITLKDVIEKSGSVEWSVNDNIYTTTNEKMIEYFKLITAPLWIGDESNGNQYVIFTKAEISVSNDELLMKLYASETDSSKLTDEDLVFSQANIKQGYKLETSSQSGEVSYSGYSLIKSGTNLNVTFTPNDGYTLLSYTLTNKQGSNEIAAYGHSSASITIDSDTKLTANYGKSSEYTMFNYSSGTSISYYYKDGTFKNESGSNTYTYNQVINSIKDDKGNSINSNIFSVEPITTFTSGKWANLYFSRDGYGLSLYSTDKDTYSGITFNSTKIIHSITITYYSISYPSRALVESSGKELIGNKESETVYSYLVNGENFSITNISGGKYLYIPAIEIVYSTTEYLQEPITITYNANGGNGEMNNQIVYTSNFNLNENLYTKPGYNFIGWSTSKDGDVIYGDGETIEGHITNDIVLYAIYEFESSKAIELIKEYNKEIEGKYEDIYAYYGGSGEYDITKYIPNFDSVLADSFELQFGKIVYVGSSEDYYRLVTANFIPVSQSYKTASEISLLDAYYELAYSYYYQGTQVQYDQGSSYQRKIRDIKPEDATELYQKYMDCSTFVSNTFYNAFGEVVIDGKSINDITTKILINYARDNIGKSNEVILYQDNLLSMTQSEKTEAMTEFKNALQPGDLYIYRHTSDTAGHVMLYVGNGYFLHSTGSSYDYKNLKDKTESYTSAQAIINPEGSVRYQSTSSTVYKESSTRYLFYIDPDGEDSNDRYAILRPLNRSGLKLTNETIARCMASGLDIEKSADKTTSVAINDTITYTIKIKNNSKKTINNISINDTITDYTTFVSMTSSYYYNQYGSELIWNIPSIGANKTISVSYTVKVSDDIANVGKKISSFGKVGHINTNTLNMSISSLNDSKLTEFKNMALQYYGNSNVSYSASPNNSTLDPTTNVVTFINGASFVTTLYKRYYATLGKTLDLSSELESITNSNFMNSLISTSGDHQKSTKLYSMLVNGGYGGTVFTKDYYMDRMRTVKCEYLLPGDIISFQNSSSTNQYLYLGDVTIASTTYQNALLLFTTSDGVKMVYGEDADELLVKFIGYKRFAIIRPSLYM